MILKGKILAELAQHKQTKKSLKAKSITVHSKHLRFVKKKTLGQMVSTFRHEMEQTKKIEDFQKAVQTVKKRNLFRSFKEYATRKQQLRLSD